MAKQPWYKSLWPFGQTKLAESPISEIMHVEQSGSSGTDIVAGYINEDYLSELTGRERADIFDKMRRSDSKIKMAVQSVINPIKSAKWDIEAASDSPEDELKKQLIEKVLFQDMNKTWKELLHEILSMVSFGYSLFERVHKFVQNDPELGSYVSYKTFAFRSQRTIERWNVNPLTAELESVTQMAYGDAQKTNVNMPAKFLTLFCIDREGQNYEGVSMLRAAYGPWLRKQNYLKLMAIGIEKFAVPTPILKVPDEKQNSTQFNNAVNVLKAYTSHQKNYVTLPVGWEIDTIKTDFDAQKVQSAIDAENREIVNAFLANFMELGSQGSTGSYALSNDLSDFFLSGLEHIADNICETFNNGPIKEIINLNYGPQPVYPKLKCSGISNKAGKELAEVMKLLVDGKVITPDDILEEHFRDIYNLPARSDLGQRQVEPQPMGQPIANAPMLTEKKSSEILLAETPRGQISRTTKELRALMQEHLTTIGYSLAANISSKFNRLPESQSLNAVTGELPKGSAAYKAELKQAMTDIAADALKQARKEVPKAKNVELAEFEDLPPKIRKFIQSQSDLLVESQLSDLEKAVYFQFTHSYDSTVDAELIRKDLAGAVDTYVGGPSLVAAASTTAAQVINTARNAFFYDDEVLEEISAFLFFNPDPVTDICKDLNGRIFAKDDPEARRYQTPLHWNCKSVIVPLLKSTNPDPKIDPRGLKPSKAKYEEDISFGEFSERLTKKQKKLVSKFLE